MTIGTCVCRGSLTNRTGLALGLVLTLALSHKALGQDATITNLYELTQAAFSESFYIPYSLPCEWRAYSLNGGEPWWVDCSALPCSDLVSASTNYTSHGVDIVPVWLTKNVQSGETLLQSDSATDVVAHIPAPIGYQPGQLSSEDGTVWRMWLQATNCPDCWGIDGAFPPPTVTLKTFLADVNDYTTYESNLEAEAEAEAEAQAASASSSATAGRFTMSEDDESGSEDDYQQDSFSCTSTGMLGIQSVTMDTNGWTTLVWGPTSTNYLYEVQAAATLSNPTSWFIVHTMIGNCGTTSWTDPAAPQQPQFFWRVQQLNFNDDADGDGLSNIAEFKLGTNLHSPDTDGDGMPDGWEVAHGLNPLDPTDAAADPDGDGFTNLQEYHYGTDPQVYNDPLDIVVNGGQPYTPSLTVTIQPLSTNSPKIRVGFDPAMTNVTVLTNSGSPINYTLPDNGDGLYQLYVQYGDAQGNAAGAAMVRTVILDRVPPVVSISAPASNAVLDQAFITLQAVAADPDPTQPMMGTRPLSIWINGQPFWDRSGTNILIERFPVPSGTNAFTVTVVAADAAGHTNQASRTWTVNTSGDTTAPQLSAFNVSTNMLLPDVGGVWTEALLDDSNAVVRAVVTSDDGVITTNSLNVRHAQVEQLLPLESGTNRVVVTASDAAGNTTSNLFTLVRSARYSVAITNPVFGAFASVPSNTVSGYVNLFFDAGLPTQTNVTSVFINGVAAVMGTNVDANGNVSFRTTNSIPLNVPITGTIGGTGIPTDPPPSIPPAQSQAYEILHKEIIDDDVYVPPHVGLVGPPPSTWNLSRGLGGGCWNASLGHKLLTTTQDLIEATGRMQESDTTRSDSPPLCLTDLNPDRIVWRAGTPSANLFTNPAPLGRDLSIGTDYTHGQGSGGYSSLVSVPGPCCCPDIFNPGYVVCSLPDQTDGSLCHSQHRGWCVDHPNWDCLTADHYDNVLSENAALTRTQRSGAIRFRAPRQYDTNTTVIFTFEGVDYKRLNGAPLDLSQVMFRGLAPFAYSNEIKTVSYMLTVDGGREYTLNQDDFAWSSSSQPGKDSEYSANTNCYAYVRSTWLYGDWTEDMHWLSWTNFHNHTVDMIIQEVGQAGYTPNLKDAAGKLKVNYRKPQEKARLSDLQQACRSAGSFSVYIYQGHAGIISNQPAVAAYTGRTYNPAKDVAWYFVPGIFGGTTNAADLYFLSTSIMPNMVSDFTGGQGISRIVMIMGCDSGTSWQTGFTQAGAKVLVYSGGEGDASTASGAINAFFNTLASSQTSTIDQALSAANQIIDSYNSHPGALGQMNELAAVYGNAISGTNTFMDIMKP